MKHLVSFPGSAGERPVREAPPPTLQTRQSLGKHRSHTEHGNEECFRFEFRISNLEFRISTFDPQPITNGTIASRKACSVK